MVEVTGLSKRFGAFTAIRDVSFTMKAGECFALLGPNGSGKTTTLKCLAGLAIPTTGTVRVGGIDLWKSPRPAKALLSYLPQGVAFPENLTAREVLAFFCRLRGLRPERADKVLDELGFDSFERKAIGEFSGGMVQRLGIAVSLLPDAPLLLLDEPASGLDPESALRFREVLRSLNRAGKTIIFSSHILAEVEQLAGTVAVIVAGKLVTVQSADRIENGFSGGARLRICVTNPHPRLLDVALQAGAADARLAQDTLIVSCPPSLRLAILHALKAADVGIERFFTEEPSLEEVYLRYVNANASGPSSNPPGSLRKPSDPAC